jgi:hypothetical protein
VLQKARYQGGTPVALRRDELLDPTPGLVVPFPLGAARARARRARMLARRRRTAAVVAGLCLAVAAGGSVSREAPVASAPGAPRSTALAAGQSLWDLAERYAAPGTDPRAYVGALQDLNGLEATPLPGHSIRLPREVGFLDGDS